MLLEYWFEVLLKKYLISSLHYNLDSKLEKLLFAIAKAKYDSRSMNYKNYLKPFHFSEKIVMLI